MKILLIGASGTVGSAVKAELSQRHEVISIGRKSGDFQVDISDSASISTSSTNPSWRKLDGCARRIAPVSGPSARS